MLRLLEHVADARSGDDVLRVHGIFADLLSQTGYSYLKDVSIATVLLPPHFRQEVILGNCFAGVARQEAEDPVLRGREEDFICS